ncbi:MAG: hypothetical protein H9893_06260 [Candidatus Niameybacter stercoravium]|nr:hypothetical protein [Candidatus Niameybacter stercoravium]
MKNSLVDVNNYLFEAIERLNDDSLSDDQLDKEIKRADAVTKVAKTIVDNTTLALNIKKHLDEYGKGDSYQIPGMIESK